MKKFYVWIFILCFIGIADAYAKGSSGGSRGGYSSSSFRSSSGSSYSSFRSSSSSKPSYQVSRPAPVVVSRPAPVVVSRPAPVVVSRPAPTPAPKVVVINRYSGNSYGNNNSRNNYSSVRERCSRGYEPVEWCVDRGYYHPRGKYYASNRGVSTSTAVAVGALAGIATGVAIAGEDSNPRVTPPVVPPVVSTAAATPAATAPVAKSLRKVPTLSCSDWNCDLQGS